MLNFLLWIIVMVIVYGLISVNSLLTNAYHNQDLNGIIYHGLYLIALTVALFGNLNIIFTPQHED